MPTELTVPLTHIARVHYYIHSGYRVCAIFRRGQVPVAEQRGGHWMFVPATVKVGDDILCDPGVTTYACPIWAERWVAPGGPAQNP